MENSEVILDFYKRANEKKYHIVDKREDRDTSEAEQTVLECIIALGIDSEYDLKFNASNTIRMLFAKSFGESAYWLELFNDYKSWNEQYKGNKSVDARVANLCTKLARDFKEDSLQEKEVYKLFNNYNKLRNTIRQGHIYWGVSGNRLESILEHIYGTCVLIMGIESEYDYKLNYAEIIKMLLLHETEEIKIGDLTAWDGVSPEEKLELGKVAVKDILGNLKKSDEYINILNEFNSKITLSAKYAYLCDKLEYDLQVKMYEDMGKYDYGNVPSNVVTTSKSVKSIMENGATGVFDVHYEYDKSKYIEVPCMKSILEKAKKLTLK